MVEDLEPDSLTTDQKMILKPAEHPILDIKNRSQTLSTSPMRVKNRGRGKLESEGCQDTRGFYVKRDRMGRRPKKADDESQSHKSLPESKKKKESS